MGPVTYSWIGVSAVAPLTFLGCAWALGVLHSGARRPLDLFLGALFVQELLSAFQAFAYALLSLSRPSAPHALCGAFVWGLSATRALQGATVASLLADRALTAHWPYRYRLAVGRHQVRYHLVVLATMAALVGVAALLARPPAPEGSPFDSCRFLPHALHVRLALFLLALHGLLLAVAAVSVGAVQASRGCPGSSNRASGANAPLPDVAPVGTTGSSSATSLSSSGRGLPRPLHPAASSASSSSTSSGGLCGGTRRAGFFSASSTTDLVGAPSLSHPPGRNAPFRGTPQSPTESDFRWSGSLAVAAVCLLLNQLPYIGLLVAGTFFRSSDAPMDWPMENVALWLSLLQGIVLPGALAVADPPFARAARRSVSYTEGQAHDHPKPHHQGGVNGPLHSATREESAAKVFPLTNGSLFPSLLSSHLYGRPKVPPPSGVRVGVVGPDFHEGLRVSAPPALPDLPPRAPHYSFFKPPPTRTLYPNSTYLPSPGVEPEEEEEDEDPIYATLSEALPSLPSSGGPEEDDDLRLGTSSATTAADDDFEFHLGPPAPICPHHRPSSLSMNDLDLLGEKTPPTGPQAGFKEEQEMMFLLPVRSESLLTLYRLYLAEDEAPPVRGVPEDQPPLTSPSPPPIQEIYHKQRTAGPLAGGVRRQHKIERAKLLQARCRAPLSGDPGGFELRRGSLPEDVLPRPSAYDAANTLRGDPLSLSVQGLDLREPTTPTPQCSFTPTRPTFGIRRVFITDYI